MRSSANSLLDVYSASRLAARDRLDAAVEIERQRKQLVIGVGFLTVAVAGVAVTAGAFTDLLNYQTNTYGMRVVNNAVNGIMPHGN